MQKGFVFDPQRCTGCQACQVACQIENQTATPTAWRRVRTFNPRRHQKIQVLQVSMACNHCAEPACLLACPADALSKDAATGAVTVDQSRCLGCNYCSWVCAYDAPQFDPARGVMEKCTLCSHRLDEGLSPACTTACPTGALECGDVAPGRGAAALPGLPESKLEPALAIRPLTRSRHGPECTAFIAETTGTDGAGLPGVESDHPLDPAPSKIALSREWPLAIFTTAAALLVGIVAATLFDPVPIDPFIVPGVAAAVMVLSALHLGAKSRVWRVHINWRFSWLSREIVLFTLFIAVAALYAGVFRGSILCGSIAAVIGLGALWAIDGVYHTIPLEPPLRAHSALVFPNGLLFMAAFGRITLLFVALSALGAFLYARHKGLMARRGKNPRLVLSLSRTGVGFVCPAILFLAGHPELYWWAVGAAALGWSIDRAEFYHHMEIVTPAGHMAAALDRSLDRQDGRSEVGEIVNR